MVGERERRGEVERRGEGEKRRGGEEGKRKVVTYLHIISLTEFET